MHTFSCKIFFAQCKALGAEEMWFMTKDVGVCEKLVLEVLEILCQGATLFKTFLAWRASPLAWAICFFQVCTTSILFAQCSAVRENSRENWPTSNQDGPRFNRPKEYECYKVINFIHNWNSWSLCQEDAWTYRLIQKVKNDFLINQFAWFI